MIYAEIIIVIMLGIVVLLALFCITLYLYLCNKNKYFYTETNQGRDLIKLLSEMDKIVDREQFLTTRNADLRKMIDERRNYYVMNNAVAFELDSLRSDYMDIITEQEELKLQKDKCQKEIDTIIDGLPKKYKNILNYNWKQFKE